jgi:hypothetical protein
MELGKSIVGGLLGVTVAKLVPPMLPASLTGSAALRVIVTGAIAFGAGMLANKMNPNFGSAVTFGGLMQTASVALNAFIPSIGSQIGLSGMGRIGDLVPGGFPMPSSPRSCRLPHPARGPSRGEGVMDQRFEHCCDLSVPEGHVGDALLIGQRDGWELVSATVETYQRQALYALFWKRPVPPQEAGREG